MREKEANDIERLEKNRGNQGKYEIMIRCCKLSSEICSKGHRCDNAREAD